MSIRDIIAAALSNEPVQMQKAFDEEISGRVSAALEAKYAEMSEAKVKEEDEVEDDADDDEDEDEMEEDDEEVVGEMKKLHASNCGKMEMYKKVHEKYGTPKDKFEGLYAQYCK
jgi:hypothetical protein